jgi:hypothetical protein
MKTYLNIYFILFFLLSCVASYYAFQYHFGFGMFCMIGVLGSLNVLLTKDKSL